MPSDSQPFVCGAKEDSVGPLGGKIRLKAVMPNASLRETWLARKRRDRIIVKISDIHRQGQADLAQIALASGGVGGIRGVGQRRQQKCRQNRNNGYDDEEFDERKTPAFPEHASSHNRTTG